MEKDIGMACQKVLKNERDDIKVKANIKRPIYLHIFFLQLLSVRPAESWGGEQGYFPGGPQTSFEKRGSTRL